MKKVIVISTSLRHGSNSDMLADKFVEGAKAAGNKVEKISLVGKEIQFCKGCFGCQKLGKCVIKDDAHSRYFGEAAYHYMVDGRADGYKFVGEPNPNPENKQLLIIPDASHCDLYDGGYEEKAGKGQPKNMIPWDTLVEFFTKNLK